VRGLAIEPSFSALELARRTPGCVGADLKALTRRASMLAVKRIRANADVEALITEADMHAAAKCIVPSSIREARCPDVYGLL